MRLNRIYYSGSLTEDEIITPSSDITHYLTNVLRLSEECEIIIFNGDGAEYFAEILEITKKQIKIHIKKRVIVHRESHLQVELAQGISRGERMDWTIQKSVELGVSIISPIFTERCEVKLEKDRLQRRIEHWQKIIISACEQSGRVRVPQLNHPITLEEWLGQDRDDLKLVCAPHAESSLSQLPTSISSVALLIGSEGGLAPDEIQHAKDAGFIALGLGPRILRTETAALAALTIAQAKWGDLA